MRPETRVSMTSDFRPRLSMEETEHKNFFRTHKVLTFLPLAALAAGVFWYVSKYNPVEYSSVEPRNIKYSEPANPGQRAGIPEREEAKAVSALDIQGSPEFKGRVTGALKLIWMADRETFLFIKKYIYIIRSEDKTDFYMDNGQPVAAISNANVFRSLPWCAGIIAHQAFHSYAKLSSMKKKGFIPPPPGTKKDLRVEANPVAFDFTSLDSILYVERKASEFQAKVLAAAGGSRAEILSVKKRAPRDFTLAHDGNYITKP